MEDRASYGLALPQERLLACTTEEYRQIILQETDVTKLRRVELFWASVAQLHQLEKGTLEEGNAHLAKRLWTQFRLGEMLKQMPKHPPTPSQFQDGTEPPSYADLGIPKTPAMRWQQLARLGEEKLAAFIEDKKGEVELTSARALALARSEERNNPAPLPTDKYRVIYADPPWAYGNTMSENFTAQRDHYETLTVQQLCDLGVRYIAEDDAVLFLWVTSPILAQAFDVVSAWGFTYKASFVWDKVKHVMGHYNSVRHEFLLVCVRGGCQPDVQRLFDSVVTEERPEGYGEHSTKPETFRQIIDTLYTHGRKLEMFARRQVDGWDFYGDEVD